MADRPPTFRIDKYPSESFVEAAVRIARTQGHRELAVRLAYAEQRRGAQTDEEAAINTLLEFDILPFSKEGVY